MRIRAFFAGVVFCVMATSAGAQNRSALIVPGKSVGNLRLGSVLPTRLLGQKPWAELVVRTPSGHPSRVSVYSAKKGTALPTISAIRFVSPEWKLANGISTSTPVSQIRRAFPALRLVATYRNPYYGNVVVVEATGQGLAFDLSPGTAASSKCLVITVFQPHSLIAALQAQSSPKVTIRSGH